MDVYLGLGSNLGDRAAHLRAGIAALGEAGTVRAQSPVYESAPMYITDQPAFLNMAVLLTTGLALPDLLAVCQQAEVRAGRDRGPGAVRNGPRPLDCDILLALAAPRPGDLAAAIRLATPALTVPHPRLHERAFVLLPLCDLAPALIDPRSGMTVCDLARAVQDQPILKLGELADL
jgi:2-amino-4-hydroxy-6-hydroxymethyldihydropteridine diphosphokinase